tara:strand:+ start:104 stop:1261 length:1158 start_codon:yes stop_codon:yes gene_type:complete
MINEHLYKNLEKRIISQNNRFKISQKDIIELKESFKNKVVLISGAAGSIGSEFTKDLIKFNFQIKKIILLDKDENMLTEINRELLLYKNFNKKNIKFVCADINSIDIQDILTKEKVQFYINFAAIKHVRSEENIYSIKYMFKTNSINFLPKKKGKLEKFFSISTDKTVNPSSILGVSKNLMEQNLSRFSKNILFVSSVRFANVSFSNGSILKYIVDRLNQKKSFGVPKNIRRFFITHSEASSLCYKSLLKRNNNKILIPNPKILRKDLLIMNLAEKIVKKYNLIPKFYKKKKSTTYIRNFCYILLTAISDGQKSYEELYSDSETLQCDIDNTVCKVDLPVYSKKIQFLLNKIIKSNDIQSLKILIKKTFKNYQSPKKFIKISKTI